MALQQILCIYYLVQFQEDQIYKFKVFLDSNSEINTITLVYIAKLDLTTSKTSIRAKKIDSLPLETYDIALTVFLLQNNLKNIKFFEKTFLLVDSNIEIVLELSFLFFNNVDVKFLVLRKLTWRFYDIAEVLPTTSKVELINKKEFIKAALNENFETFVIYITTLETMLIHFFKVIQVT